jgi:hypothetical protein
MINQYYFIVNIDYEPERYDSIISAINTLKLKNYTIKKGQWANEISDEYYNEIANYKDHMKIFDRDFSLSKAEISLFINYMSCLNDIRNNYTDGYFVIFESDAIFNDNFNENLETVIKLAENIDYDIINIGDGTSPKPENIKPGLNLYKQKRNKGSDAILWKYSAVCKFIDYVKIIDFPIDSKIDVYSEFDGGFNIYWAHPSLVYQGSFNGIFKSHIH